jgi:beta-lactamase regulating signal transducer with metallopeptidase domain
MRLDTANRSFVGLLGAAFVAYQLLGLGACVLLSLLGFRIATHGVGQLGADGAQLGATALFLALVGLGALLGIASLVVQLRDSVRLADRVRALALPAPPALTQAAARAGLAGRVSLIDSKGSFSFAYGAFTPRVVVSRGLFKAASPSELAAVLEHERYHVGNLDPLKVMIARALPAALFYLPALRDLRSRYVAGRELAADQRALAACGRSPLAGALVKVLRSPAWPELGAAAAIGGAELLEIRVQQLETGGEPRVARVSKRALLLSALGATVLSASVVVSLAASGGLVAALRATMPGMDAGALGALGMAACVLPWLVAGWLGYRWLAWRAAKPLDTSAQ